MNSAQKKKKALSKNQNLKMKNAHFLEYQEDKLKIQ